LRIRKILQIASAPPGWEKVCVEFDNEWRAPIAVWALVELEDGEALVTGFDFDDLSHFELQQVCDTSCSYEFRSETGE
jgi:hypothetical protein